MAIGDAESNETSSTYSNPYDDPLYLSASDYPGMQLVNTLFNGRNYLHWSRGVVLALGSKNKEGFLNGKTAMPDSKSPKLPQWRRCDNMIRCWILNTLNADIKEGFMSSKSAKDLWSEIGERYGQSNGPLLYQLKKELRNLESVPVCACGAMDGCTCQIHKKMLDIASKEKVMTFLMGLHDTYDALRSNILSMEPMPNINKAYSIIQQIESQKQITSLLHSTQDVSALVVDKSGGGSLPSMTWRRDHKKSRVDDRWCSYCKKHGHTNDTCFRLHPEQKTGQGQGNQGQGSQEITDAAINFAGKIFATNVTTSSCTSMVWIVDSGATDHMVASRDVLINNRVLIKPILVGLPDGTTRTVTKIGEVQIHPKILLHDVLFVPGFKHNLLSVGKLLSRDGICKVHKYVELLHSRLGHTSVGKMEHITAVKTADLQSFKCEMCSLAKLHRLPFDRSDARATCLFELIHLDLWGPYKFASLTGAHYFLTIVDDYSRVTWTFLLKEKTQVPATIEGFFLQIQNQFGRTVKKIRSDNGTEFLQTSCFKMRCIFLGYPYGQKAYKLYDLTSHKVIISRDVVFHEHVFPYKTAPEVVPSPTTCHVPLFPPCDQLFSAEDNRNAEILPAHTEISRPDMDEISHGDDAMDDAPRVFGDPSAAGPSDRPARSTKIPSKLRDFVCPTLRRRQVNPTVDTSANFSLHMSLLATSKRNLIRTGFPLCKRSWMP
ncbi:hypothetical protein RND81_02G201300 [Saponaria officinalis]|uniref:Integrase catalytic domain-containing protein n=1 Tax=Saponaria officinalis TaxID=3572 RepID=A0AAW1MRU1_SAPOF